MSNTITAIMPTIFAGLNVVSRELIGLASLAQRNTDITRAAVGQTVMVPVVPPATTGDVVPASTPPNDGDQTMAEIPVSITASKYSPVRWNGEEQLALGPTGQFNKILADQFAESFRALANLIEVDGFAAATQHASRVYGTLGTAPFGTAGDLTDFAGVNQALDVNGAPASGRSLVVGSAARFNLEGKQSVLFKMNEAGTDGLLRDRVLNRVMGLNLGYSAGVSQIAAGTGAGFLVNNPAGYAVGATQIAVDTGTGTIPAGTVVTFAGDTNKYVSHGITGGILTIGAPGLRQALADNAAVTVGGAYTPSVAFTQDALMLAARAPALPTAGDSATDRQTVVDPISGIPFEIAHYLEYRRSRFEVAVAWGWAAPNPSHLALLGG